MISIQRADERDETRQPGIVTRHCFASGGHYDPANLRFGPLIALDEHTVSPGAGFAEHAHRGVELISWVLDGTLCHTDRSGRSELVRPGTVQRQVAGAGIHHSETNACQDAPLRFVQAWLEHDSRAEPRYELSPTPVRGDQAEVSVLSPRPATRLAARGWAFVYVCDGRIDLDGTPLRAGDSVRIREAEASVTGGGHLLLLSGPGDEALSVTTSTE